MTLACEDANSKLVEVISVADVDGGKRVGDSLVQIFHSICHQRLMIDDNHPSIHYPTKPLNEMSRPCQDDLQWTRMKWDELGQTKTEKREYEMTIEITQTSRRIPSFSVWKPVLHSSYRWSCFFPSPKFFFWTRWGRNCKIRSPSGAYTTGVSILIS